MIGCAVRKLVLGLIVELDGEGHECLREQSGEGLISIHRGHDRPRETGASN